MVAASAGRVTLSNNQITDHVRRDNLKNAIYDGSLKYSGCPSMTAKPDSDGSGFDACGIAPGIVLATGCDGPDMFDPAEDARGLVPVAVDEGVQGGDGFAVRHRLDSGPGTSDFHLGAPCI